MKLDDALSSIDYLYIESSPIIYFVEANPQYDALVSAIFQRVDEARLLGCTSVLTVTEVCSKPAQQGRYDLVAAYRELLLSRFLFWKTLPIDIATAARAADLRARYALKTPDALHLATALETGCKAFLTNDKQLKRVTELPVLVLDDLEI